MVKEVGKRFLKAIRHKIINPIKRRLTNEHAVQDVIVGPVHENRSTAAPARFVPFQRRMPNLNQETTPAVPECTATVTGLEQNPEQPSVILAGKSDSQDRRLGTVKAVESETLKSNENNSQRPLQDPKYTQQQHKRSHSVNSSYHQEMTFPTSTTLRIGQTAQTTAEGTPVTNLDISPKQPEVTTVTEQHTDVERRLDIVSVDERYDQTNVQHSKPPAIDDTGPTSTKNKPIQAKTFQAPRKRRRPATTNGKPVISKAQDMPCFTLIKEAQRYHTRVFRVRGAAKSYAHAFGLEAASRKRPYVVMGCAFNALLGILMVNLCAIVSLKDPEPGQASRVSKRNSRLIPIEPNKPNPNAILAQVHFGDDGLQFGNHSWIDVSKIYKVPVDLIKEGPDASLKLCKCSWEKLRETLSMGTLAEETFGIEREFKRFQKKMNGGGVGPDYGIRMADSIPQLQPQTKPEKELRPRLRRYQVDELLHLQ